MKIIVNLNNSHIFAELPIRVQSKFITSFTAVANGAIFMSFNCHCGKTSYFMKESELHRRLLKGESVEYYGEGPLIECEHKMTLSLISPLDVLGKRFK